ncbi:MAG: saccharopine dehydrogenase NADP-binding domain-containing protein [Kineosporiaceae bacterium]
MTTPSPPVAVLGATGEVGREAVRRLARAGSAPLRLGGRDGARAAAVADTVRAVVEVEARTVDLDHPAALAAFCDGCRVVVNCAGPSYRVLDTVARAAWAAGADYVDVGGESPARDALVAGAAPEGRVAVFSAGVMPGLSGILPRLLTGRPLRRLESYVGGAAAFTPLSAVDALLTRGDRFGTAMAVARDGAVVANATSPLRAVHLPGFPVPMAAWPFLTAEARALPAREVRAYNVFRSDRVPQALARAWAELSPDAPVADIARHAPAVVEASRGDVAESGAFYVMLFAARPEPGAPAGPTRVLLTAQDSYALSGAVMAWTAVAVLRGDVVPGAHLAADVLDPGAVAALLRDDPLVDSFAVT